MSTAFSHIVHASCVAIGGRALMIEGPPGSGKSSLALSLIDRGAGLISDDAVHLARCGAVLIASAAPNIAGLVELRGVGIITLPVAEPAPLALILQLGGPEGERLPDGLAMRAMGGLAIPVLPFAPGPLAPAVRAEYALRLHGLASPSPDPA